MGVVGAAIKGFGRALKVAKRNKASADMFKKSKTATIKSVKPFSKTGAKSAESWKSSAAKAKLGAAQFNLKETFKKSDKALVYSKKEKKHTVKMFQRWPLQAEELEVKALKNNGWYRKSNQRFRTSW